MRSVAIVLLLAGCGGPVCEPCIREPVVCSSTASSSVSTSPDLDEDFACVARMTHGRGEAGATFGFSRHTDGTASSRTSSLALEDASCTFEARYAPRFGDGAPGACGGWDCDDIVVTPGK